MADIKIKAFGITEYPYNQSFHPFIGASIKSHLIFTQDGVNIIDNDSTQHSYRRNKGKTFFNEQWRDMLIALLFSLQDNNEEIKAFSKPV